MKEKFGPEQENRIENKEELGEKSRLLTIAKEIESISPIAAEWNKDEWKAFYALEKAGRSDLVFPYLELLIATGTEELDKGDIHCRGCFCKHKIDDTISKFIYEVDDKDVEEAVNKTLAFIEKAENTKFPVDDDFEGTPERSKYKFISMILYRLGSTTDGDTIKLMLDVLTKKENIEGMINGSIGADENVAYSGEVREYRDPEIKHKIIKAIANKKEVSDNDKLDYINNVLLVKNPLPTADAVATVLELDVNEEDKASFADSVYADIDNKWEGDHFSVEGIDQRRFILELLAKSGVPIKDLDKKMKRLLKEAQYIKDNITGVLWADKPLSDVEVTEDKVRSLVGEKKEDVGPGLHIEKARHSDGEKIYLDGQFVAISYGAKFSDRPTNNDILVWADDEIIDYDNIRNSQQIRHNVWAFKTGWEGPRVVFECHGWSRLEDVPSVSLPEVTQEGKVVFEVMTGGKKENKEIGLE